MEDSPLADWVRLSLVPGIGCRTYRKLIETFGSPSAVLSASQAQLGQAGLKPATIAALRAPDPALISAILAWANQPDAHLVTLADARYPTLLAQIHDPPQILYVRGQVELLCDPQIAIVGSRNPTPAGVEITQFFARRLAEFGLVVTSGLAIGIDGAAHEGALERGETIAVLGTGPDRVYPARHRDLARRILKQGALVSEFPPGCGALAKHFPRRNRLISGMSLGVLVTEAALQSGSLITARLALEQGRKVFAIPGSIRNPMARGCHALIREGAELVEDPAELIAELAPGLRAALKREIGDVPPPQMASGLSPEQSQLLVAMGHDPVTLDDLTRRTGLPVEQINAALLLMELAGHVSSLPGGRYTRTT
ncbi:DNA-protecting protein DprA [Caldichromatium japonicum]|uniref:DNA-protecting protein DprA n=1 Tax=Caldichromatium japonicum TaxID=2699430 RepID=A0A6G7VH31_9GAMM|nr:DNA-protecting protein DprA [Caldichromatium japonicum]